MTSSLVGSEMCIRDSHSAGESARPGCGPVDVFWGNARVCHPAGRSCRAVSYTHLTLPTICSV
eukprot:11437965-Prorocentrum_lima.AAC.1